MQQLGSEPFGFMAPRPEVSSNAIPKQSTLHPGQFVLPMYNS